MNLSKEVIGGIQTAIQLMGNANFHCSATQRQALMTQLNPKLKQLFLGAHFRHHHSSWEKILGHRLEASEALRKSVPLESSMNNSL